MVYISDIRPDKPGQGDAFEKGPIRRPDKRFTLFVILILIVIIIALILLGG